METLAVNFDFIITRLNAMGGNIKERYEFCRDDPRAALVHVYNTQYKNIVVKVVGTPDITMIGIYGEIPGALMPLEYLDFERWGFYDIGHMKTLFKEDLGYSGMVMHSKVQGFELDVQENMVIQLLNQIAYHLT